MPKIRFLIDRVIKSTELPNTYLDADLVMSIFSGIEFLNAVSPPTSYTILNFPELLKSYLVLCGSYWALSSQFMLESDLAFAYTGQSVSLDYDRTGPIESELGRLESMINEQLPKAKRAVLRAGTLGAVGVTARPSGLGELIINRTQRIVRRG